jgi:hypothetical protein
MAIGTSWVTQSNILPALFGLVGVVVGGLITALSSYYLEKFRARREEQRESRERDARLREAVRMLYEAIIEAMGIAEYTIEHERPAVVEMPTVRRIDQYLPLLAGHVSNEMWQHIGNARTAILQLTQLLKGGHLDKPLVAELRDVLNDMVKALLRGAIAMAPLTSAKTRELEERLLKANQRHFTDRRAP